MGSNPTATAISDALTGEQMKKLLLIVALVLSGLPLANEAALAKAGSKCTKVGATKGSLVCKRINGKLVWTKKAVAAPKPTPGSTSTPTPVLLSNTPVTSQSELSALTACRLENKTDNLFHLGFPIDPVLKQTRSINVFAIPIEFSDTDQDRLSVQATNDMFAATSKFFQQQSFGRTEVRFTFPPVDAATNRPTTIRLSEPATTSEYIIGKAPYDLESLVKRVLNATPTAWNLSSFDSVLVYFQDTRSRNTIGGQGWRGSNSSKMGQFPFQSPSGPIVSTTVSSAIISVLTHELGHSLFGFIDLYDSAAGQSYARNWGNMAAAFTGEFAFRGWEKWLAGWTLDSQIRCTDKTSTHFLSYQHASGDLPQLLVIPLSNQRALVVEALELSEVPRELNGGALTACKSDRNCPAAPGQRGALVYLLDVSKLSALGAVVVPEQLAFPKVLVPGQELPLEGYRIRTSACDISGCVIEVFKASKCLCSQRKSLLAGTRDFKLRVRDSRRTLFFWLAFQ